MVFKPPSSLDAMAQQRLERLQRDSKTKVNPGTLLEWIPKVTTRYAAPVHLLPLINLLQRIIAGERIRIVVHTPPRHGKTETLLHFIAWGLLQRPDWTFGYCSYNAGIALSKSKVARDIALHAGIQLSLKNASEWRTLSRGGTLAGGMGGTLTGHGLNVGIVDDPVKNRVEAESAGARLRAKEWFSDVFMTRIEPGGSVIVNMARWHPDDLAGHLINEKGWPYLCLPALTEEDESHVKRALWPERWPVSELELRKVDVGPYSWASLYQGQPRPRGGSVFGDPIAWADDDGTIAEARTRGLSMIKAPGYWKAGMGLDLAFTAKSSSDWSVIVVMKEWESQAFVWDVLRVQQRAPEFKQLVRRYKQQYPTARIRWYAAGTEQGSADFFSTQDFTSTGSKLPGITVEVIRPNGDKFTRAIPYAASWNARKVAVPGDSDKYPWVNKFIEEHVNFTGVNDLTDDQVDAGSAAHDLVMGPPSGYRSVRDAGGQSTTRRL